MSRPKYPSIRTPPAKRIFHPRTHFCPRSYILSIHTKKRISGKRPIIQKPPSTLTQSGGIVIFAQVKVSIKERMAKTHLQSTPDLVQGGSFMAKTSQTQTFSPPPGPFWYLQGGHPKYGQYFVFDPKGSKLTPVLPLVLTKEEKYVSDMFY